MALYTVRRAPKIDEFAVVATTPQSFCPFKQRVQSAQKMQQVLPVVFELADCRQSATHNVKCTSMHGVKQLLTTSGRQHAAEKFAVLMTVSVECLELIFANVFAK